MTSSNFRPCTYVEKQGRLRGPPVLISLSSFFQTDIALSPVSNVLRVFKDREFRRSQRRLSPPILVSVAVSDILGVQNPRPFHSISQFRLSTVLVVDNFSFDAPRYRQQEDVFAL
ncbi:unnamed protein product [Toxocara canis]|uniref:Uncharacterized protein n=1 Tax=Toxocara canis TaxID=6265 RepID=A0A183U1I4_TOXCA|nr:unnamed protein product [Toxocara canis]